MTEMQLPRQPEPVTITFSGDQRDIAYYMRLIDRAIDARSYDNVQRISDTELKIYPAAVND